MLSAYFRRAIVFALVVTCCNALIIPPGEGSLVSVPAPLINISMPETTEPTTAPNDYEPDCKGAQYGTNIRYESCLDAFGTFKNGGAANPVRIGRRSTGTDYAQNVPWKWVSGDGRCIFDITMRGRNAFEVTSGKEIARAAWKLMNKCVRDQGGQGGVYTGIGRGRTLAVTIRPHDPSNVRCGLTNQKYEENKCEPVIDILPADATPPRRWGPRSQPDVDVPIPFSWAATPPYQDCRVYVFGTSIERPARDEMSFYDMWEAAVMIQGMCARFDKPGIIRGLGSRKLLSVAIDDGSKSPYIKVDNAGILNETAVTTGSFSRDEWNGFSA